MADNEKIRRVVAAILADPRSWHQDSVVDETPCGTTFCIAGHAAVLEGWEVRACRPWSHAVMLVPPGTPESSDDEFSIDIVLEFAQDTLGLDSHQADELFYWMPQYLGDSEEKEIFTPEGLVEKVKDITGVDCYDLLKNQDRRGKALAGVQWIRDNLDKWDQHRFVTFREDGTVAFCWAGAVLHLNGYRVGQYGFLDHDGSPRASGDLLAEVLNAKMGVGIISSIIAYDPDILDEEAVDELERRVLAWLGKVEKMNEEN